MKLATIVLTFIVIGISFLPFSAQASAITNLAGKAQTIEIETPQGYTKLSIEAGRTYRVLGAMRVRFNNYTVYIERNQEFAIWPSGDFGPQKIHDIKRPM